ncbi:hypothetical protein RFI_06933 [Reticulomyxa filosa]|uniref:Uncharacterized protein n=1 Tax=Reticulomyxa filosa TaxID=46433 RepID=X6NY26_RETFI|nr:hypothetical protein RFI_06933 [Reticulomyxa filosa]|eukprot:ETO30192.1 hypothetical protein RFI_06933 [Reticulomyxa filosa]
MSQDTKAILANMATFQDVESPMKPTSFGPLKLIVNVRESAEMIESNKRTYASNVANVQTKANSNYNLKNASQQNLKEEILQKEFVLNGFNKNNKENADPAFSEKKNIGRNNTWPGDKSEQTENEVLKEKIKQLEMEIIHLKTIIHQLQGNTANDYLKKNYEFDDCIGNTSGNNTKKSAMRNTWEENKNVNFEARVEVVCDAINGQRCSDLYITSEKASQLRQIRMSTPHPTRSTSECSNSNEVPTEQAQTNARDYLYLQPNFSNQTDKVSVQNIVQDLDMIMSRDFYFFYFFCLDGVIQRRVFLFERLSFFPVHIPQTVMETCTVVNKALKRR